MTTFDRRFDEVCITKGSARYGGPFTPSTTAISYAPGIGTGPRTYTPGDGFSDPQSYLEVSHADLVADAFSIHTGDFTIETRFRIDTLYQMLEGEPLPRYAICGQYDDYMWAGDEEAAPGNWWSLEFYNDTFIFRVWDATSSTYVTSVEGPIDMQWATSYTNNMKDNLSEEFVHIAVVRQDDVVRLFVNGVHAAVGGEAAITDWDEIHKSLEINGQDGRLNPDIPYSVTYIEELRILNYALFWEDFTVPIPFSQLPGLCIYPRIFPQLINGVPGDIHAKFPVHVSMGSTILFATFAESASISHIISGGFDLEDSTSESASISDVTSPDLMVDSFQESARISHYTEGSDKFWARHIFPNLSGKHLTLKFIDKGSALYQMRMKMFKTADRVDFDARHPNLSGDHLTLKITHAASGEFLLAYTSMGILRKAE